MVEVDTMLRWKAPLLKMPRLDAYNVRATRIKLLVYDGFGVWCAARRLNTGHFIWPRPTNAGVGADPLTLTQQQFDALVLGLPWQQLGSMQSLTRR